LRVFQLVTRNPSNIPSLRANLRPSSSTQAACTYSTISHLRCLLGNGTIGTLGCNVSTDWVKHEKAICRIDDNINLNVSFSSHSSKCAIDGTRFTAYGTRCLRLVGNVGNYFKEQCVDLLDFQKSSKSKN